MKRNIWHRLLLGCGAALLLTGWGQAQYVNSLNGQRFEFLWGSTNHYVSNSMMQRSIMSSLGASDSGTGAPPAPAQTSFKYPLSRMDFRFQGKPTAQKNCAAIGETQEGKQLLSDICLQIFTEIQKLPEFRANNLASGLTLVIGLSLQVARDTELSDDQSEQLLRSLNDLLVDTPGIQKLSAAARQQLYETWVMTGGLISAVAQAGAEANDEPTSALAKALAATVLREFGFED